MIYKLYELKNDDHYSVNTQFEQVTFKGLNSLAVTAMIEKVQLNDHDMEQTLIVGVILDLIYKMEKRLKLPYESIKHFRDYASPSNTIQISLTNIPYTGVEAFAFLLIADRLCELRPSYKETLADKFGKQGGEDTKYKSLSDEDVWYSHLEVADDHTIVLHFIVLTFEVREQMKN